jgi:hypothetical protein
MSYLIAILVIGLATGLGWAVLKPASASAETPRPVTMVYTMAAEKPGMDREALAKRLKELSTAPVPKDLKPGAMCYEPAMLPSKAEYMCPVCREKTLYALPEEGEKGIALRELPMITSMVNSELPACRRLVKEIKGISAELEESEFCRKCHPEVKTPRLGLTLRYSDLAKPHQVWGVTADDLRLLVEFLDGKTKHVGEADRESPMKDHLKRLDELLGFKAE